MGVIWLPDQSATKVTVVAGQVYVRDEMELRPHPVAAPQAGFALCEGQAYGPVTAGQIAERIPPQVPPPQVPGV